MWQTWVSPFQAAAEVGYQLSGQRGDNLLSIGGSFVPENFPQDSVPDSPIERREADVDGHRRLPASLFNKATNFVQEVRELSWFRFQLHFCHPYTFTMSITPISEQ
jgi:hypothetical protein